MSKNFTIRCATYEQVSTWSYGDSSGQYIEMMSGPWDAGDKFRTKRFGSILKLQAYINKLHIGGWITDDEYDTVWLLSLRLVQHSVLMNSSVRESL